MHAISDSDSRSGEESAAHGSTPANDANPDVQSHTSSRRFQYPRIRPLATPRVGASFDPTVVANYISESEEIPVAEGANWHPAAPPTIEEPPVVRPPPSIPGQTRRRRVFRRLHAMPLSEPPLPPLAVEWTSFSFDRKITKTWRGRQVHFLLASSADIPLYHGRAKRKQEMVLIAREVSNLMSESSLDAVLVGTPHQQQFSLRNQSLVGNELLTLQMDRSGGVKQIVVVLRNRGRAKPILLDGSAQNGMLTFSEKGERRALVTNREDGRIAMSVHPNIEELHAFAILIALFFLEKGNQFVI